MKKLLSLLAVTTMLAACETTTDDASGTGSDAYGDSSNGVGRGNVGEGYLAENVPDRVFFDYDSSALDQQDQGILQSQAEWLNANQSVRVTVEGHADERGTREYNLALGERRANSAVNYLTSLGVDAGRINTISYGKERPAVTGSDENAWAQNRRSVTVIAE